MVSAYFEQWNTTVGHQESQHLSFDTLCRVLWANRTEIHVASDTAKDSAYWSTQRSYTHRIVSLSRKGVIVSLTPTECPSL